MATATMVGRCCCLFLHEHIPRFRISSTCKASRCIDSAFPFPFTRSADCHRHRNSASDYYGIVSVIIIIVSFLGLLTRDNQSIYFHCESVCVCAWAGDWVSDFIGLTIKGDKTQQCRYISGDAVTFLLFHFSLPVLFSFRSHFIFALARTPFTGLVWSLALIGVAYDAFRW